MNLKNLFFSFIFLLLSNISFSQKGTSIKMNGTNKSFLTMHHFTSNYSTDILPYTPNYVIDNKIKKISLNTYEDGDTYFNEFHFNTNGVLKEVTYFYKKSKDYAATYTFSEYSDDKRKYAVTTTTSYGDDVEYIDFDLKNPSSTTAIGDVYILKDAVSVTKCIIHLNDPELIVKKKPLLKNLKLIVEQHDLQNRRGVNFEIISMKENKPFQLLKFNYSDQAKIDKYTEIQQYFYNSNGFIVKKESSFYLSKEKRRATVYTYNTKNMLTDIVATGGGDYDSNITIKYDDTKIDTVNYYYRNELKRDVTFNYTYFE